MTVDAIFKYRIEYKEKHGAFPEKIVVTEDQRKQLLSDRNIFTSANLTTMEYMRDDVLKCYGIIITTPDRENLRQACACVKIVSVPHIETLLDLGEVFSGRGFSCHAYCETHDVRGPDRQFIQHAILDAETHACRQWIPGDTWLKMA